MNLPAMNMKLAKVNDELAKAKSQVTMLKFFSSFDVFLIYRVSAPADAHDGRVTGDVGISVVAW